MLSFFCRLMGAKAGQWILIKGTRFGKESFPERAKIKQ